MDLTYRYFEELQKNIEKVFNGILICKVDNSKWCFSYFKKIVEQDENIAIKDDAIQLYINTMINIYTKPSNIKYTMRFVFGCSHYYRFSLQAPLLLIIQQSGPIINAGIIRSLLESKCVLVLSFVNYLIKI